ncbi:hypothetical protein [Rhodococcus sp. NPDC047139]|uniref:hypothetical protein n=1 Tax=Rhodococcus sp. NPDC047139 TaxID=3155141 RepID=UPI0033E46D72
MQDETAQSMRTSAIVAVLSGPVAAGVTASVWQFPVVMVGNTGGTLGAVFGAIFSMFVFMTIFSFLGGAVAVALVGAGAGYLVRGRSVKAHALAGLAGGALAALVVAVAGAFLGADAISTD